MAQSNFTSQTSAQLAGENVFRHSLSAFNEGDGVLYVLLGTGIASTTNYTYQVASGELWEAPPGYVGAVQAIFDGTGGTARVTDCTTVGN